MAEVNPYVSELFKLANNLGVPLIQNLQASKAPEPKQLDAVFSQKMHDNTLNGSGPSDPAIANQSSPITLLDQVTGRHSSPDPKAESGGDDGKWMLLIALGGALILLASRRR